ncbi:MAG: DUF2807 domain-containing protein [Chloroflexi bacterium]|nr:DUF2807 domain-containing protein [Chloroflexota bacterium]
MESDPKEQLPPRRGHFILWPTILILLGVLFLLSNFGLLPSGFWGTIWHFWPVILILLGLEILLTRSLGSKTSGLISILVVLCMVLLFIWLSTTMGNGPTIWPGPWNWNVLSGSGHVITQQKDLAGFTQVEASGPLEVEIAQSNTFSVTVTVDDNLLDHVVASVDREKLRLSTENLRLFFGWPTLKARITMPSLRSLRLSRAVKGTITGFKSTDDFALEVMGASKLEGSLDSGNTKIDASSASRVNLEGSGSNADLKASGASKLELGNFQVKNAKVTVDGASSATVNVTGRLDVNASGASSVYYLGNPTLGEVNISGASKLERR